MPATRALGGGGKTWLLHSASTYRMKPCTSLARVQRPNTQCTWTANIACMGKKDHSQLARGEGERPACFSPRSSVKWRHQFLGGQVEGFDSETVAARVQTWCKLKAACKLYRGSGALQHHVTWSARGRAAQHSEPAQHRERDIGNNPAKSTLLPGKGAWLPCYLGRQTRLSAFIFLQAPNLNLMLIILRGRI